MYKAASVVAGYRWLCFTSSTPRDVIVLARLCLLWNEAFVRKKALLP